MGHVDNFRELTLVRFYRIIGAFSTFLSASCLLHCARRLTIVDIIVPPHHVIPGLCTNFLINGPRKVVNEKGKPYAFNVSTSVSVNALVQLCNLPCLQPWVASDTRERDEV